MFEIGIIEVMWVSATTVNVIAAGVLVYGLFRQKVTIQTLREVLNTTSVDLVTVTRTNGALDALIKGKDAALTDAMVKLKKKNSDLKGLLSEQEKVVEDIFSLKLSNMVPSAHTEDSLFNKYGSDIFKVLVSDNVEILLADFINNIEENLKCPRFQKICSEWPNYKAIEDNESIKIYAPLIFAYVKSCIVNKKKNSAVNKEGGSQQSYFSLDESCLTKCHCDLS